MAFPVAAGFCAAQDMSASAVIQAPVGNGSGVVGSNMGRGMTLSQGPGFGLSQQPLNFNPVIPGVVTPQTAVPSLQRAGLQAPAIQPGLGLPQTLPQDARATPFQTQSYLSPETPPGRTLPASTPQNQAADQPAAQTAQIPGAGPEARPATVPLNMTRQGGPSRIGGPSLDPRSQGADAAAKGGALGAMKEIDKARGQQLKGGADPNLSGKLDSMFDFSQNRNGGMLESMAKGPSGMKEMSEASALPDPKVLGADQALSKMRGLAGSAAEADAPFLYQHAVGMAREQLPGARADGMVSRILRDAWRKAPEAVQTVGQGAMDAAAQGRTTDALHFTKAVYGWNELLSTAKGPFIANFAEFRDAVKHVLAQAQKSQGGAQSASPKVTFKPVESGERARLKALVSLPQGMAGQVAAVPVKLPEALALDQSIVAWETQAAPETPGLSAAFALTPRAGFRDFYRARREAGDSVLRSFWLASRQFLGAAASGLWQRVKDFLLAVLRFFGLVRGAVSGGTVVDAAPDALKAVRSAPAQRLALPPASVGLEKDSLGLGYRLHRVAP